MSEIFKEQLKQPKAKSHHPMENCMRLSLLAVSNLEFNNGLRSQSEN